MKLLKNIILHTLVAINIIALVTVVVAVVFGSYMWGYIGGYNNAASESQTAVNNLLESLQLQVSSQEEKTTPDATPQVVYIKQPQSAIYQAPNWSGPELWAAVNKRRQELGVNALDSKSELCTIASIRLNELLELGKLDGHEGFSTLPERREDLKWIFEKYNISEFLVSGASSAEEAVSLWENTLGHKKLLTGGEYVWGCTYAQNSFGVAIAAY